MKVVRWLVLVLALFLVAGCSYPIEDSSKDAVNSGGSTRSSTARNQTDKGDKSRDTTGNISADKENTNSSNSTKTEGTQIPKVDSTKQDVKSEQFEKKNLLYVVLYYQDSSNNIVPVSRRVDRQEGIARAAVSGLIDHPVNREEIEYYGIFPVLPLGTKILGLDIKQGTAIIDFNSKVLSYKDESAERNVITSIVYTLTEFKSIDSVKILVEGKTPGKLKYGTDVSSILSRGNIMVNSKKANLSLGSQKLDIYLFKHFNERFEYLIPLSIEMSRVNQDEVPSRIIELLARDYSSKKFYTQLPANARLLSSTLRGNVLTLNFNPELKSYGGGTARENGLVKQILFSMKQVEGAEKVKILIDGKETVLQEGTEVSKEIAFPAVLNDFVDSD